MTTARTAVPALAKNDVYSLLHPHACTTADNASRRTQSQLVATFGISPQEACPHYPCMVPICGFFFFFVTLCVTPSITVYL